MKVGNKIALFYTGIIVSLIAVVTIVFYFFAIHSISHLYYSFLTDKAYATAEKHWEKDEVDADSYASIQKHYEETLPVISEILLDADKTEETSRLLSRYLLEKEIQKLYNKEVIQFKHNEQVGVALYYPDNEGNFIVLIISNNQYGKEIQKYTGWLFLAFLLISAILVYLVGKMYAIRMVDRIDAAYHREKAFISNASHELNNPLTAIQGECEISLLKERTPAEYQSALLRIASETKRIIQLMKHLLFLSHGDEEILKNAQEPILLADFIKQMQNNRIACITDSSDFTVHANPYLLKVALGNLLDNACKYSGNKPVEVKLEANILSIIDNGIGIPESELKQISQPFYRASNTRGYAGHGIGLSLSFRILRIYGAKVTINSVLHKGTIIRIEFST